MLTAIAIDDEPRALSIIRDFTAAYPWFRLLDTFTKTEEALSFLTGNQVDLIFLDIQMPAMNGLQFFNSIPEEKRPLVIFTTAFSEYAVEGFNVEAVDFLLKPFTRERFEKALLRARDRVEFIRENNREEGILIVKADYGLHKINLSEIQLIEGSDDYVLIHLDNRKPLMVRMTMKNILEKLPAPRFIRVHRSYIVPLNRIDSVRQKTIFILGREIPIGASFEEGFYTVFQ